MKDYALITVDGHSQDRDGRGPELSVSKRKALWLPDLNLQNSYVALIAKKREGTSLE